MAMVELTPTDFNAAILEHIKSLMQKAYEQGVNDGRDKYDLPMLLTRQDIANQMQISLASVDRITCLPGITKCQLVKARYPRDAFFKFLQENERVIGKIRIRHL